MSLNEVCSPLDFIRVTVLKRVTLNLFALAPAPGCMGQYSNLPSAVLWWKKVTVVHQGLIFLWYVLFSALINFASSQCKYFKTTFNSQGPLVQSRLKKTLKSGLKFFLAFYFVQKNFLKWFSLFLLDHPIIKLYTKGMNWIWFVFFYN